MAVNSGNDKPNNNSAEQVNQQETRGREERGGRRRSRTSNGERGNGFRNSRSEMGRAGSRSRGDSLVKVLATESQKIIDSQFAGTADRVKVIPIDNRYHYQMAVFVNVREIDGQKVAGFVTLILEGSNKLPNNKYLTDGDIETIQYVTPMDAWGPATSRSVTEYVESNMPGTIMCSAEAMVVPASLDLEDEDAVNDLLLTAYDACVNEIGRAFPGQVEVLSLTNHDPNTEDLKAVYNFDVNGSRDVLGRDVRADFTVTLRSETKRARDYGDLDAFMQDEGTDLMEVAGYVDVVYSPDDDSDDRRREDREWTARIVVTNVLAFSMPMAYETYFLALSMLNPLKNNYNWLPALLKRDSNHDLGSIGYRSSNGERGEVIGQKIEELSMLSTSNDAAYEIVRDMFFPDAIVSIDCEVAGANTPFTNLLATSVPGHSECVDSNDDLITRLNAATDGLFEDYLVAECNANNQEIAVMFDENNQVLLGNYVDDGVNRDWRDIDNLYTLTYHGPNGSAGLDEAINFAATYDDVESDPIMRLDLRTRMADDMIGKTRRALYGRAFRENVAPEALTAMDAAMVDLGIRIEADGLQAFRSINRRGNTAVRSRDLGGRSQSFSSRGGRQNGAGNNRRAYASSQRRR